jgi:hypothetical protein
MRIKTKFRGPPPFPKNEEKNILLYLNIYFLGPILLYTFLEALSLPLKCAKDRF